MLRYGQRDILTPRSGNDLDTDGQTFGRGAVTYDGSRPAREIVSGGEAVTGQIITSYCCIKADMPILNIPQCVIKASNLAVSTAKSARSWPRCTINGEGSAVPYICRNVLTVAPPSAPSNPRKRLKACSIPSGRVSVLDENWERALAASSTA
jgi:hypothetical protein